MAEQRKNYSNGQYSGRNTSQNVVEIDLVSLFNFSMKRWRILLVLMIVLAILFAGVKALKTYSELNTLKTIENGGMETVKQLRKTSLRNILFMRI